MLFDVYINYAQYCISNYGHLSPISSKLQLRMLNEQPVPATGDHFLVFYHFLVVQMIQWTLVNRTYSLFMILYLENLFSLCFHMSYA